MTRGLGPLAMALGILLLAGCSADAGTPVPSPNAGGPQGGAALDDARPVLAPGTTAATGAFVDTGAASGAITGSVAITVDDEGIFQLVVTDLSVADGLATQFTLTADSLSPDEACLDSDWRFGLGQVDAGHDPAALVFPIGGSDGIGQGDLSFIREVVLTRAPSSGTADKACPIPIVSHAPLVWSIPDMRPGLDVEDSGATAGAMGIVTIDSDDKPIAYTVAQGDTLSAIAQRFGIALDDLFYLNPRRSPNPEDAQAFTGEVLNLSRGNR